MKKIKYFDKEISVEEFIEIELCKNKGTQCHAFKKDLIKLCETKGLEVDDNL